MKERGWGGEKTLKENQIVGNKQQYLSSSSWPSQRNSENTKRWWQHFSWGKVMPDKVFDVSIEAGGVQRQQKESVQRYKRWLNHWFGSSSAESSFFFSFAMYRNRIGTRFCAAERIAAQSFLPSFLWGPNGLLQLLYTYPRIVMCLGDWRHSTDRLLKGELETSPPKRQTVDDGSANCAPLRIATRVCLGWKTFGTKKGTAPVRSY